ncbi:uncharacterized protein LOC129272565 [Lytechinus pictus]|uniref:uncharacterized protein LOC129272565 n=1 Tax=Lytechinus pictus TaxID=7653 RepID=UPI0030B9CB07
MTITCDQGSTINIIKGACVRVTNCSAYNPSLDSQCDESDKTTGWATYCRTANPCIITGTCKSGETCPGEYTYIYADYECIPDETTTPTTVTGRTSEAQVPVPAQYDPTHRKAALFKRVKGWRLQNHVIKTKQGTSLVRCGAECNGQDGCVSFNVCNGVCQLNDGMVGGDGVAEGDYVVDERCKYFEKQ